MAEQLVPIICRTEIKFFFLRRMKAMEVNVPRSLIARKGMSGRFIKAMIFILLIPQAGSSEEFHKIVLSTMRKQLFLRREEECSSQRRAAEISIFILLNSTVQTPSGLQAKKAMTAGLFFHS